MQFFLLVISIISSAASSSSIEDEDRYHDYLDILDVSHGFGDPPSSGVRDGYRRPKYSSFYSKRPKPTIDFDRPDLYYSPGGELFLDLMRNYNVDVRPVNTTSSPVVIRLLLKLTQLLDIDEKSQIMTTNVWLHHEWNDWGLRWDPNEYGGIERLNIPAENIWLPDTVLYNNADGDYQITIHTKVEVHYDGLIIWEPPAIYKSFCAIDVEFFPYDFQTCELKFGPWTYDFAQVNYWLVGPDGNTSNHQEDAVDMSGFYESTEWDLIHVHADRRVYPYPCCPDELYVDITYLFNIRRKTLFYTINLIIPCIMITFLTVLVFYLPSGSTQKIAFTISTLLSLTWFILLLSEIIPPTSLVLPLMGKYLIFTMSLVTLSIAISVLVLHSHFRHPYGYEMPSWIRCLFLKLFPQILCFVLEIEPGKDAGGSNLEPKPSDKKIRKRSKNGSCSSSILMANSWVFKPGFESQTPRSSAESGRKKRRVCKQKLKKKKNQRIVNILDLIRQALPILEPFVVQFQDVRDAIKAIQFIAQRFERETVEAALRDDWQAVSRVIDRFFLFAFSIASTLGTLAILLWAPSLFDRTPGLLRTHTREVIDRSYPDQDLEN